MCSVPLPAKLRSGICVEKLSYKYVHNAQAVSNWTVGQKVPAGDGTTWSEVLKITSSYAAEVRKHNHTLHSLRTLYTLPAGRYFSIST